MVRVEELKSERELMKQGFAQMDTRFEEMLHTNHWMTFLTIVLLVIGSAMTLATVFVG